MAAMAGARMRSGGHTAACGRMGRTGHLPPHATHNYQGSATAASMLAAVAGARTRACACACAMRRAALGNYADSNDDADARVRPGVRATRPHVRASAEDAAGPRGTARAGAVVAAAAASLVLLQGTLLPPPPAHALLVSPNAQVARTVDAALRRSIPAFNADVKSVQRALEDIQLQNRIPQRKPWGSMAASLRPALELATERRSVLLDGVPPERMDEANAMVDRLLTCIQKLDLAIATQSPDLLGLRVSESLKAVSELEILEAPGLAYQVPKPYQNMPRLTGRAVVRLTVEKADGSDAFVRPGIGGLTSSANVTLTLDGYSAPVTAGNFVVNVLDGLYDGRRIDTSFTNMYVPGRLDKPRPPVPLEQLPLGEFDPVYRLPLAVQDGELPTLPLSIDGAVAMAHTPGDDTAVSGDEWFVFKFDKQQAGLAGLAFDEGTFGVFGYVTDGMDAIRSLQRGDLIVRAEVVAGQERLVRPAPPPATDQ